MITPATEILNQKGTPMFNSDLFSNRPAAGIAGRIFISTDTKEFYRDTGSTWELIGGPGAGTVTGSGTIGTLPIWNGSTSLGNSSLLEASTKFTTTKAFQSSSIYLNDMTAGAGALYYNVSANRLTLANYNVNGNVVIEAGGGANAQFISGTDLSTTFYGSIIRNGGTSSQFLKADGSLDSTDYQPLLTNPVTGTGSATQVAFWTGSSAIGGNNDLWWDNVNDYLGIKTNSPISELDVVGQGYFHPSVTAAANAGWASSYAFTTATIPATTFSNLGNVFCGATGINSMLYNGDATFQQANVPAAVIGNNIFRFGSSGLTISLNQGSGLRAFSAVTAFNQVQSNFVGTITHLAGVHVLSPYASNQLMNVTNYYGLLINNATERAAFTITNRWGIYQDGALDRNYFAGNVLIKSNVDNGSALQVTGNITNTSGGSFTFFNLENTTANSSNRNWSIITNAVVFGDFTIRQSNTQGGNPISGTDRLYISPTGAATFSSSVTAGGLIASMGNNFTLVQGDIQFQSNLGYGILSQNSSRILAFTNTSVVSNVNVGIGVTPSAWGGNTNKVIEFSNGVSLLGNLAVPAAYLVTNAYSANGGSTWLYKNTDKATQYIQYDGQHIWYTAPSGTAGNPITFTQAMTLNASGQLGIGTPNPSTAILHLNYNAINNRALRLQDQNGIFDFITSGAGQNHSFGFYDDTNSAYRFFVTPAGNFLIGSTTDTGNKLYLNGSLRIDGQRSGTAGGNSGQHLIITLDGIQYKIALLNP